MHIAKGSLLAAALDEIRGSSFIFKDPYKIAISYGQKRPTVLGLSIYEGYQYALNGYNYKKESLGKNRDRIEKYQNRIYIISRRKELKRKD